MDLKLSGKRALVTGSTAGIGEAIARLLAVEGASIAIHGRDEGRGNQLVDELKGGGTRTVFIKADLSVPDDIVALAEQAHTTLGGVDVIVNNAAVYPQHTWFESSADEWTRLYAVNVVEARARRGYGTTQFDCPRSPPVGSGSESRVSTRMRESVAPDRNWSHAMRMRSTFWISSDAAVRPADAI